MLRLLAILLVIVILQDNAEVKSETHDLPEITLERR